MSHNYKSYQMGHTPHYIFQYDGETLRIIDSYLPGIVGYGGVTHYKLVGDSVFIKIYDEVTSNQTIELKL